MRKVWLPFPSGSLNHRVSWHLSLLASALLSGRWEGDAGPIMNLGQGCSCTQTLEPRGRRVALPSCPMTTVGYPRVGRLAGELAILRGQGSLCWCDSPFQPLRKPPRSPCQLPSTVRALGRIG